LAGPTSHLYAPMAIFRGLEVGLQWNGGNLISVVE
jgi:hypothetical protein